MNGRETTVVSIRIPDSVYTILKERAKELSVAEYIKQRIIASVNTTKIVEEPIHSVNQTVNTIKVEGIIPKYDKTKHKKGDIVLVQEGKNWVRAIVPEMDMDGNKIWE